MSGEVVVRARELTARAGDAVLVDGVDLDVAAGAVTALVGPSGSGKTTTALALLGESEPGVRLAGSVLVAGHEVVAGGGDAHVLGGTVAYMPQHPAATLNPARRVGAVLTELARLHAPEDGADRSAARRQARATAARALRRAQLPDDRGTLRRFPHQFSGGQRQRLALAQVLACRPRAVVLDEPGTGLDPATRLAVASELTALADDGIAVLLLSHDHALVRRLAQHVVRLEEGRVTAQGLPGEVLPDRRSFAVGPTLPQPRPVDARPPEARPAVLETQGLTAWLRPGRRDAVLHDVALRLDPAECLGVAGRSGSGKTTLARCVAGLHERRDGRLLLDGRPLPLLRDRSTEQRRRVQYVWQEVRGSFDERRTVLDQVARTAVRLRGLDRDRATEEAAALLARLDVAEETAARPPASLSGGQLQRAALARALLAEPDVLLCDEITSALDEHATGLVTGELARAREERGTAVVWIGHDIPLLGAVADRVVVLEAGRVAEHGEAGEVLASPRTGATRQLLGADPATQQVLTATDT
ncbi:ABC transporter ATP-binding protein [Streptomyces xiaopingdaonensis]|uniref:ABC transporter ATP-binding protein n=1 Tax=Streptomyces xiaopingdaonensis TaxID=1565415 RepID=UPI0003657618|nr:ATP-binding cassette domain-containing protein [Streptomyces xiaopingdaonensis]